LEIFDLRRVEIEILTKALCDFIKKHPINSTGCSIEDLTMALFVLGCNDNELLINLKGIEKR